MRRQRAQEIIQFATENPYSWDNEPRNLYLPDSLPTNRLDIVPDSWAHYIQLKGTDPQDRYEKISICWPADWTSGDFPQSIETAENYVSSVASLFRMGMLKAFVLPTEDASYVHYPTKLRPKYVTHRIMFPHKGRNMVLISILLVPNNLFFPT